jgi:lysophospholipase L1-like esterase
LPSTQSALFKPLLAVAAVAVVLGVPELTLRAIGFHYESGVEYRLPQGDPSFVFYHPDPELHFKFDPAHPDVNSFGFPDEEVALPKPQGVYRILFLGDSCTQQGYPGRVTEQLNDAPAQGAPRYGAVVLAVAGYSSFQGQVMARTLAPEMDGDLAVVFFGWNDHWLANGAPDSRRIPVEADLGSLQRFAHFAQTQSRLVQFLVRLRVEASRKSESSSGQLRVPLGEYRENLEDIERRLRALDLPVVFLTAPTAHYRFGAPAQLVSGGFATDQESVPRLHRMYNEVVREVARDTGAFLLDLEREFESLDTSALKEIFTDDGIHFTESGLDRLGRRVASFLQEEDIVAKTSVAPGLIRTPGLAGDQ